MLAALAGEARRPPLAKLAVGAMPLSGSAAELMRAAGIDADAIVVAVRCLLARGPQPLARMGAAPRTAA